MFDIYFKKASIGERILAFILDCMIVTIVSKITFMLTSETLSFFKIFAIYYFSFTYFSEKTLGKAFMGLKSISKDFEKPTLIKTIIKTILIPFTILFDLPSRITGIYTVKVER